MLQIYENCEVELELVLQIWNTDDRTIKDEDHRQRPDTEKRILKKRKTIEEPMTTFEHMNYMMSVYQDYAVLTQINDQILFYSGRDKIVVYEILRRKSRTYNLKDK